MTTEFPKDFLWGCATSAFQIEGSPLADGAGPSIWQRFEETPGMMFNGDKGNVACDHYNRFKDDVALMKTLGMRAYRFSVAWGRILPEGTGRVNEGGLKFYSDLIDELLKNDIEPILTLFHWDMPAALDDLGGWLNRDCADWFAGYARVMFERFDGRVKKWATLNEPWVVTDGGYLHGALAPGHRNKYEAPIAAHNIMRAHGAAVKVYREIGKHEIGLVVNIEPKYAASASPEYKAATKRAHAYMNEQFLDPAMKGTYPPELKEIFGAAWPDWPAEDMALIHQKLDFLGINYYTRSVTRHEGEAGNAGVGNGMAFHKPPSWPLFASRVIQEGATYSETGWEVFPQGLTDTLIWVRDRYGNIPLYITENGSAFFDPPVAEGGRVRDPLRMDYMQKHLKAVKAAIDAGVPVKGYMVWSFMDNLEWSLGFSKRFGIVHVNYKTLERTPKDSAHYYTKVMASNGAILAEPLP